MPQDTQQQKLDKLLQKSDSITSPSDNNSAEPLCSEGINTFEASWGTVSVDVSNDFLEAHLISVEFSDNNEKITTESISNLLQQHHITCNLQKDTYSDLAENLQKNHDWLGRLLIAQGRPPGVPGGVDFVMFDKNSSAKLAYGNKLQIADEIISFQKLIEFFNSPLAPGTCPGILCKAISACEVIAERLEPIKVRVGRDVFGRVIKPAKFSDLMVGKHVQLTNDKRSFEAMTYGYISIIDRQVSILSPLLISDDEMTAWYIVLPQHEPVRMPCLKDIIGLLKNAGVTRGIKQQPLEKFCHVLEHGQVACWNVIAKGQEPIRGKDARLEFITDIEKSSGKIRDDDSIDLRELNLVQTVLTDDLIATKHPLTQGIPGYTLTGAPLETNEPGDDLKVKAKDNVRTEEKEDSTIHFYAECDGLIRYKQGKLSIEPIYKINGNVDFSTGNVDVDCALEISGNICSDFTVKSTSDVLVGGSIDPGAKLEIGGNLEVKGGIRGETTEITVLGNMKADFIQTGTGQSHQTMRTDFVQSVKLLVKGDLIVNQYIYYAVIKAVGKIIVGPGTGKRGGSIVGGVSCSSTGIKLSVCGSPSFVPTLLILEPTPTKLAKLRKLKKNLALCDATTTKIMQTLNVDSIKKETVTQLLQSADEKHKKLYVDLITKLNNTITDKQQILSDLDVLKKELYHDLSKMKIIVTRCYHGNTRLRIGKKEFLEKQDRAPSQFTFQKKVVHVEAITAGDKKTDIF